MKLRKYHVKVATLRKAFWQQVRSNPVPVFGVLFTILYFLAACIGNLDIGIRHMLPLFPWMAFFSVLWMVYILEKRMYKTIPIGKILIGVVITTFILITISIFPNYIPYTTEFVGGAPQAYRYYNDSNVDWGQSIKPLAVYAKTHPYVLPLYTDQQFYDPKIYYFCGPVAGCSKLNLISDSQLPPKGSYFAVSEMQLTIDWASSNDNLALLKQKTPVAKIGDSIYLYHL